MKGKNINLTAGFHGLLVDFAVFCCFVIIWKFLKKKPGPKCNVLLFKKCFCFTIIINT